MGCDNENTDQQRCIYEGNGAKEIEQKRGESKDTNRGILRQTKNQQSTYWSDIIPKRCWTLIGQQTSVRALYNSIEWTKSLWREQATTSHIIWYMCWNVLRGIYVSCFPLFASPSHVSLSISRNFFFSSSHWPAHFSLASCFLSFASRCRFFPR